MTELKPVILFGVAPTIVETKAGFYAHYQRVAGGWEHITPTRPTWDEAVQDWNEYSILVKWEG